jgi:hypothetical protein
MAASTVGVGVVGRPGLDQHGFRLFTRHDIRFPYAYAASEHGLEFAPVPRNQSIRS